MQLILLTIATITIEHLSLERNKSKQIANLLRNS